AAVDDAVSVADPYIVPVDAKLDQLVEAGDSRRAAAGACEFNRLQFFADDEQRVQDGGADDDGGHMLVVMEIRDVHALAQFSLDVKALGCLDILEVDSSE